MLPALNSMSPTPRWEKAISVTMATAADEPSESANPAKFGRMTLRAAYASRAHRPIGGLRQATAQTAHLLAHRQ